MAHARSLSPEVAAAAKADLASGRVTIPEAAAKYRVRPMLLRHIISGRNYADVWPPGPITNWKRATPGRKTRHGKAKLVRLERRPEGPTERDLEMRAAGIDRAIREGEIVPVVVSASMVVGLPIRGATSYAEIRERAARELARQLAAGPEWAIDELRFVHGGA